MTSYTPNIPQPGDDPSDSQDQILQNFQTLNSLYGTSGDHYPWTNTTPTEGAKHARVTLPGLPTTNVPGNLVPTPGNGNCALFAVTRNSQTTPFIARDGLASPTPPDYVNLWPLLPIKGFARVSSTAYNNATLVQSFNIATVTAAGASPNQTFTFTLTNQMRTTDYGILALSSTVASFNFTLSYTIVSNQQFTVRVNGNAVAFQPFNFTVIALET
jgi:hypothetical protein